MLLRVRSMIPVVLGLFGLGCMGGQPMTDRVRDLGLHIDGLSAVTAAHGTEVSSIQDVAAVSAVEETHLHDATLHLEAMQHDLGTMDCCRMAGGGGVDTSGMMTVVTTAMTECQNHMAAMRGAASMDAALVEESRHQAAMNDLTSRMMAGHDTMMGSAGTTMCCSMM